MKALPWICGLSLVANLALVAHTASRSFTARAAAESAAASTATSATLAAKPAFLVPPPSAEGEPTAFVRADTPLGKTLDGSDLHAMRAALEASGLTADDAKAVIRTRIRERQAAARQAIDQRRSPQEEVWWYQDEQARNQFEEQRRADRKVLGDELTQTLAAVFGPEPAKPDADPVHRQAQFLPESKRLAVSRILQDYEAMQREARPRNYNGATLPSDDEKRAFIDAERRQDLAAILSPEEMRDYDLRHSSTANDLRWRMTAMKPTLDEYEAIYEVQAELTRDYDNRGSGEKPPGFWEKRQEAEQAGFEKLRQQLGEDRFIDYALSNDYQARQVDLVIERFALPRETARDLWRLRQAAGEQGKAIHDDTKLTRDEKIARLAVVAQESRRAVDQVLTPEARAELKQNNLVNWVDGLEKNHITIHSPTGNSSSGYSL
ncbi:MAG: hypothetical protein H7067_05555 [Burkholderiales bacterium]|nr:hypothetical protein [Opitutaceae bacterium]